MNIEADIEATIALETHSHTQEYNPLPETRAMLYKQGQPVTSKEAKTLRRAYLSQDLLQHMKQREKWKSESTAEKICWIAHQRALQRMNSTNKTRVHKFIHRWLPTNKKLHDYNKDHTNKCPFPRRRPVLPEQPTIRQPGLRPPSSTKWSHPHCQQHHAQRSGLCNGSRSWRPVPQLS